MKHYISNLRNFATFSVIILHVSAIFVDSYGRIPRNSWQVSNIIDAFTRFSVPIFLMISGTVLLGREEPIKIFLGKRFKRILLPFIFWSLVYFVLNFNLNDTSRNVVDLVKYFAGSFFKGTSFHFWYIYLILGIYLFIPIINKWVRSATKHELLYFLFIWSITLFINKRTEQYFPRIELMYFSKYIGYLVLGYYLDKHISTARKNSGYLSFFLIVIGTVSTSLLTDIFTTNSGEFVSFFYEYLQPNVTVLSIGVFLFFKHFFDFSNNLLANLANNSYGVYLAHVFVLNAITHFIPYFAVQNNAYLLFLYIIVVSCLSYTVSYAIIAFLSRFKYLKNYIN